MNVCVNLSDVLSQVLSMAIVFGGFWLVRLVFFPER